VALEDLWTSSPILEVTIWYHCLIYIAETPEHLLTMKIDFLPSISLQSFQSHCVTLEWRNIDNPSSFSFRIKRPRTHRNSWIYAFNTWHTSENPPGNQMHREAEILCFFSLSTMDITDHLPFRRPFHYIISDERQNVVAKTNILTMFKDLKPRTIFSKIY
jgi:hypothetical protein